MISVKRVNGEVFVRMPEKCCNDLPRIEWEVMKRKFTERQARDFIAGIYAAGIHDTGDKTDIHVDWSDIMEIISDHFGDSLAREIDAIVTERIDDCVG